MSRHDTLIKILQFSLSDRNPTTDRHFDLDVWTERSSWLCKHVAILLVKLKSESGSPVEWTASDSSPTGSTRAFISYLFKPTELDAVNPSNAIQLKPQTRPLLLLQATLGSISVGRATGLIYRACQNSFLHLPATCNNQPHCSAHYTAAADRAAGTLSIYGSRAWILELNTPLLKCFLLWHAAIMTQDNLNSDTGWAVQRGGSYTRWFA